MSTVGFTQNSNISKYVVDKQTSFTCQHITFSEDTDTVIFQQAVFFYSAFVKIDSAEKIIYNKRTKKLIMEPNFKGQMTMNDGKNGMKLISQVDFPNGDDIKKIRSIEYTIGDHFVIEK
jgi:hypothetical protein